MRLLIKLGSSGGAYHAVVVLQYTMRKLWWCLFNDKAYTMRKLWWCLFNDKAYTMRKLWWYLFNDKAYTMKKLWWCLSCCGGASVYNEEALVVLIQ